MKNHHREPLGQVQKRFSDFLKILDELEPEDLDIDEIDRLLALLDEIEESLQKLKCPPGKGGFFYTENFKLSMERFLFSVFKVSNLSLRLMDGNPAIVAEA